MSTPVVPWLSYYQLDPRFAGSNSAGAEVFFQSVKILSITSFGREGKPCVPYHIFTARKKKPQAEIRASEQNFLDFSCSL